MLVIRTIKLSGNPLPRLKTLTRVRAGYDQYVCTNKKPGRVHQQQIIQWKQDMTLPLIFRRQIQFQFYPAHQFGFNPEEIGHVCYAKVLIQNYKKSFAEGEVVNSNGDVIGRVYIQFMLVNDGLSKLPAQIQTRITVSSMLAHFDNYEGEKGYFAIRIDGESTMTPQIDFVAGQLLWAEKLHLPLFQDLSDQKQLITSLFIDQALIGQASIKVKDIKSVGTKYRKLPILDPKQNQKCGMLFLDINIRQKKPQPQHANTKSTSTLPSVHKTPIKSNNNNTTSKRQMAHYIDAPLPIQVQVQRQRERERQRQREKKSKSNLQLYPQLKYKPQLIKLLDNKLNKNDRSSSLLSKYYK